MNPARDYRYFLRRPSQRPDSGVHATFRERGSERPPQSEPTWARPTQQPPPSAPTELQVALETIEQLKLELREEREQRLQIEEELERRCEERLQEMSTSYHDTLSALRRSYEERLRRAEAIASS